MKVSDLLRKINGIGSAYTPDESIPDEETRNRALRSLRRQKRMLVDDPREKEFLKKQIKDELRRREREFFSSGDSLKQKNFMTPIKGKQPKKLLERKSTLMGKSGFFK